MKTLGGHLSAIKETLNWAPQSFESETVSIEAVVGHRMSQELSEPLTEKEIINVAIADKVRFKITSKTVGPR